MSGDHVEAFQRGLEAFGRGDVEAAAEAETFDVFVPSYTDLRDIGGDRLLAIGSIRMRGRGSGLESDVLTAAVVEHRDGRPSRPLGSRTSPATT